MTSSSAHGDDNLITSSLYLFSEACVYSGYHLPKNAARVQYNATKFRLIDCFTRRALPLQLRGGEPMPGILPKEPSLKLIPADLSKLLPDSSFCRDR